MSSIKVNKITEDLLLVAHNPAAMLPRVMETLQAFQDDSEAYELNHPSDPIAWSAEMAVLLGHSAIEAARMELPKQYPILSSEPMDLYKHMSDRDHIDIFAQPSAANLVLLLDKQEVMDKSIEVDTRGNRKLVIPRDSFVNVAGYIFTLQYPIEIRVLSYGAIQVVWDTTNASPISAVETDALDWTSSFIPGLEKEVLSINIPMLQYSIKTTTDVITPDLGWRTTITFTDQFFCARVWMRKNNAWVELKVTFANDVYDINDPTAVLRLNDKKVEVYIPEIYINTGQVAGTIRVDIYETLGPLSVNLGNYAGKDFSITMKDMGGEIEPRFYNPIQSLSLLQVTAKASTVGGRRALKFNELRDRVITNSVGVRQLPITEKQLASRASDLGMEISKPIDYVTGRIFNASVSMLNSTLSEVSSPIGTASLPLDFTFAEMEGLPSVRDNGKRKTLTPDTIYIIAGSKLQIDKTMTSGWNGLRAQDLAIMGNATNYYYSPFYYVVDTNSNTLDVRAYDLATPKVTSKRFIESNETTQVDVVTKNYSLSRRDDNYILTVVTKSEKTYKDLSDDQVFTQLSFTPRGYDGEYAWVNGTLVGYLDDERVWEFVLGTELDVDRNNEIITNTFTLLGDTPSEIAMPLCGEFNLFYGTKAYYPKDYKRTNMDTIIKGPTRDSYGVTHELLKICLGSALTHLWSKSRAVTGSIQYEHHPDDVPYVYEYDVYARDELDNRKYTVVRDDDDKPSIVYEYDHRKGDIVYEADGVTPKIRYERGSVVTDEAGNPVIKNGRSIKYRTEMSVFDARYLFANTEETIAYREAIRKQIVDVVTNTIPDFADTLLERTELYFKPKTTISDIEIRRDDGSTDYLPAENQFQIRYYLTAAARNNGELLDNIKLTTRTTLAKWLSTNKTVSVSDMTKELKNQLNDSIISVEMEKMGPDEDIRMFTVLTEAAHSAIAKKLVMEVDGKIGLRDDIVISYTRHDKDK